MSQSPVNIVYPIDGATYPIIDPACKVKSAYFTASFGTTCAGGPRSLKWGFDAATLGNAKFYDQFSAQFTWKLPAGSHTFWVESSCGKASVHDCVSRATSHHDRTVEAETAFERGVSWICLPVLGAGGIVDFYLRCRVA